MEDSRPVNPQAEAEDREDQTTGFRGDFLDLFQQKWHLGFVILGLLSIFQNKSKHNLSFRTVITQVITLLGFTVVTMRMEGILSKRIVNPVLDYIFGLKDIKKRNEELEKMEAMLRQKLNNLDEAQAAEEIKEQKN
mmetsp:Transcript_12607/g.16312  ORF Transcript_12607/g.16312 Transcript_12607/m.16312 type:complete len:136 (-) Transcript_12607:645-1052(-)